MLDIIISSANLYDEDIKLMRLYTKTDTKETKQQWETFQERAIFLWEFFHCFPLNVESNYDSQWFDCSCRTQQIYHLLFVKAPIYFYPVLMKLLLKLLELTFFLFKHKTATKLFFYKNDQRTLFKRKCTLFDRKYGW